MFSSQSSPSLSLRTKVLILLSLIFLVLAGFSIIAALREFDRSRHELQVELQWIARWIESENHRHIAQAGVIAFSVIEHIRNGLTEEVCASGVAGAPGLDPEFGHFAIADSAGNISCNSIPWLSEGNVANHDYFKQATGLEDTSVVALTDSRDPHEHPALLARAMRNHGHVQSVILVAMDFSWVEEEIGYAKLAEGSHVLLTGSDGTVIAGSRNIEEAIGTNIAASPYYTGVLAANGSSFEGPGFGGKHGIIIPHQFSTGSGPMRVILDVPDESISDPLYRRLAADITLSAAFFAILIALVYFWTDKNLLARLKRVEGAARQIAGGDLSTRIGLSGTDEISQLAVTFDRMVDALSERQAEVSAAQDELYRVNRALKVLSAGNKSLLLAKSEQELLERMCHDIVDVGGYLAAWIGFTGPEGDRYLYPAASYTRSDDDDYRLAWAGAGKELDPVLRAVREDRILVINDTEEESVHPQLAEQSVKLGCRSMIILPLHFEGKPFGVMMLCAYRKNEFSGIQVEYLKETASDASFGIEMLRTKGEKNRLELLGEHHEQMLRESLEETLTAIAMTIEMRDPYTAGHQRRVADLAKHIAIELKLDDEDAHAIYLASIVHDIGKINIPAEILTRPGRLDPLEYNLIRQHVTASYEILKGIKFPWPLADMVHQHHERMDGSGYPLGLKNGEILFGARIMAVADVLEAMTSHRPYRAGLGVEIALKEIEQGKGITYDATVAEAAIKLLREGRYRLQS